MYCVNHSFRLPDKGGGGKYKLVVLFLNYNKSKNRLNGKVVLNIENMFLLLIIKILTPIADLGLCEFNIHLCTYF